jgi:2-(3-amino-3-carboxypropyl)histidine synthase
MKRIENLLKERKINYMTMMVSELSVEQLKQLDKIDVFVQLSCPRLSIDWGLYFEKPLLNSYEFYVFMD